VKSILSLTIAAFFWGLNFHLAKVMLQTVGSIEAGFWRYLFGVVLLVVATNITRISLDDIKNNLTGILLVGGIGLFGFNMFFFWGLSNTSAVNAALIISLNPALTLILSNRILKTPLTGKSMIGIVIALFGVLYLMTQGNFYNLQQLRFGLGDILILIANVLFALHHVWVKKYSTGISINVFTTLTNAVCMIGFLIVAVFTGMKDITTYPSSFWLSVIGIGCVGTGVAYLLWNKAIKDIGADRGGVFMNVVPLSAAALSVLFGEHLYFYHFISGLIILTGVTLTLKRRGFLSSATSPEKG
jgi:drug/metabolite transporter (DMT)-like permease